MRKVLYLILLCCTVVTAGWYRIDIEYRESYVNASHIHKGFQYVSVSDQGVYKRELSSSQWVKVYSDTGSNEESRFFSYKDELFWQKHSNAVTLVTEDDGKSWKESPNLFREKSKVIIGIGNNIVTDGQYGDLYLQKRGFNDTIWQNLPQFKHYGINNLSKGKNSLYLSMYGRIMVSSDSGFTWTEKKEGLPTRASVRDVYEHSPDTLFAATEEGIYQSNNAGDSWELIHDQFSFVHKHTLDKLQGGRATFYGFNDSVLYQFNIEDRSFTKIPLPTNEDLTIGVIEIQDTAIYVGGGNGLWISKDDGISWSLLHKGLDAIGMSASIAIAGDTTVVLHHSSTKQGILMQSFDRGQSWENKTVVDGWEKAPYIVGDSIIVDTIDLYVHNDTLYKAFNSLYLSADYGQSWEFIIGSAEFSGFYEVIKLDSMIILLLGSVGEFETYISHNNGASFESYVNEYKSIGGLGVYKEKTLIAYSGNIDSVFFSENYGKSWTPLIPLDEIEFTSEVSVHMDIFFAAGIRDGVEEYLYSIDGGKKWHSLIKTNDISISASDMGLAFDDTKFAIYNKNALTNIYIKTFEELIGESSVLNSQNVDNTAFYFHAKTVGNNVSITFPVQEKSTYELTLFSLQGRQLTTQKGLVKAGTQMITLQNLSLAKGVYIVELQMGEQKRVELIRM